jgi:hypothetical protein
MTTAIYLAIAIVFAIAAYGAAALGMALRNPASVEYEFWKKRSTRALEILRFATPMIAVLLAFGCLGNVVLALKSLGGGV